MFCRIMSQKNIWDISFFYSVERCRGEVHYLENHLHEVKNKVNKSKILISGRECNQSTWSSSRLGYVLFLALGGRFRGVFYYVFKLFYMFLYVLFPITVKKEVYWNIFLKIKNKTMSSSNLEALNIETFGCFLWMFWSWLPYSIRHWV